MENDLLYVPVKDLDEARRIGRALVDERLAGCVNILPQIQSIYRWKNSLTEDSEALMLVKTPRHMTARASERIRALHSYEVPCIGVIDLSLNKEYGEWLSTVAGEFT